MILMTTADILDNLINAKNHCEDLNIRSRELSLVITKIDEAIMWLQRGMEIKAILND